MDFTTALESVSDKLWLIPTHVFGIGVRKDEFKAIKLQYTKITVRCKLHFLTGDVTVAFAF